MPTNKSGIIALLLGAALLMQSCRESTLYPNRGNGPDINPTVAIADVLGVEWELEAFETWSNGSLVDESDVPGGQHYTLTFRQEGLGGENDCNSYGAKYTLGANKAISITDIISTKVACGPDSRDDEFNAVLGGATSYELTSTTLRIFQTDPKIVFSSVNPRKALRFKRVKAPEIQLMQLELVDLAASDPYTILSTEIQGDIIRLKVQYSGGCKDHTFNLIGPFTIPPGDPTPVTAYLHHNAYDDACEALITQELSFDLTPLKNRWKNVTGKPSGTIALTINDMHAGSIGPMTYSISGGGSGNPKWLDDTIAAIASRPVANPPESIWQYTYNGATVYYRPPICCDLFSILYDVNGNVLCAPDGGITGNGDGKCTDFVSSRTNETLIWKDPR